MPQVVAVNKGGIALHGANPSRQEHVHTKDAVHMRPSVVQNGMIRSRGPLTQDELTAG